MLSRISNLGGGKFGVENAISNLGGGKFGAENDISNLQFGDGWKIWGGKLLSRMWKIWGGKCYLESRIWGLENLGSKMLSPPPPQIESFEIAFSTPNAISKPQIRDPWIAFGVEPKCCLESRIWEMEHFPPQIFHPPKLEIWEMEHFPP